MVKKELERTDVLANFDQFYLQAFRQLAEKHGFVYKLVNNIITQGEERLGELDGKQFVMASNHRSHLDYMIHGKILMENLPIDQFPRIVAGKNLDIKALKLFNLDFSKMNVCWAYRGEKRDVQEDWIKYVQESLANGDNFLVFPEGGRNRKKDGVNRFKNGFLRQVLDASIGKKEIYVLPSAIDYQSVVEEPFYKAIDSGKNRCGILGKIQYYGADGLAFLTQPLRKKGDMAISYGEPIEISKTNKPGVLYKELHKRVSELSRKNLELLAKL